MPFKEKRGGSREHGQDEELDDDEDSYSSVKNFWSFDDEDEGIEEMELMQDPASSASDQSRAETVVAYLTRMEARHVKGKSTRGRQGFTSYQSWLCI